MIADVERPIKKGDYPSLWGSDVIADMLRGIGMKYIALVPGASFRGLHDSLVNHLGNDDPRTLLCLHEEHSVAIAHGYAKITGEPMAAVLHSNVGLMNASMAVFNAWCDRVPILLLGATGPVDAAERRPWIDWLHTCRDQGSLIRPFIKWDDQPASIGAAVEAILRANLLTRTAPHGPVYVNFDVSLQETELTSTPEPPDFARFLPPAPAVPGPRSVAEVVDLLRNAGSVVILAGRVSRSPDDWALRVAIAETIGARVLTDIKVGAAFPTDHPLHCGRPSFFLDENGAEALRGADVILSLDWLDLAGTLSQAGKVNGKVVQISMDYQLHTGWGMEHQALPKVDLHLPVDPDVAMRAMADAMGIEPGSPPADEPLRAVVTIDERDAEIGLSGLAAAVGEGLRDQVVSLVRLPIGWQGNALHFRHPLDFLGYDGGGGVGSGPGMLIGAALALQGSSRLAVAVLGDGDFMMSNSALWTAARYKIPLVAIISNNRSFYNDEIHQERVAIRRGRPVENKWIGQHIGGPDIDLAAIAEAQGATGIGPVKTVGELSDAVAKAVELAREGRVVVIDARVSPGYDPETARKLGAFPSKL